MMVTTNGTFSTISHSVRGQLASRYGAGVLLVDRQHHMSDFQERQPVPGEESQLQGLLFTGEVIRSLTPEQVEALGQMALSFGMEMKLIHHVEHDLGRTAIITPEKGETEKEPVLARRRDFVTFAVEHGYPKMRAWKAWNRSVCLGEEPSQLFEGDTLPAIRLLIKENEFGDFPLWENQVIDLRSVYARLKQSRLDPDYYGAPDIQVEFLAHLCNEVLRPDEPLPIEVT